MTPPFSIYIHIPFCTHRCAYCDFNTFSRQEAHIPAYVDGLIKELEFLSHQTNPHSSPSIGSVFFGGGTPSLLTGGEITRILDTLRATFHILDDAEITLEANPGTINLEKMQAFLNAGINRISLGVQSTNPGELLMLERQHDFFDVIEAISTARKTGVKNLNLDLIYGLPEQTLESWQVSVMRCVDLHPEHISAYALTLEHGTPFGHWASKGMLPLPDQDLSADMYEWTEACLEKNGYVHYEISNWSKPGMECRHNLQYWHSLPYLGFGAGAHGYADGIRYSNVLRIKTYIDRMASPSTESNFPLSPAAVNHKRQTQKDEISDYMINNLRLVEQGVSCADFKARFGKNLMDVFSQEVDGLIEAGLLEKKVSGETETLRLTKRGRLLGNRVFVRFV